MNLQVLPFQSHVLIQIHLQCVDDYEELMTPFVSLKMLIRWHDLHHFVKGTKDILQ